MDNITLSKAKQIASRIHSKYKEDSKPPTGNQNCQLCTWCAEAQFRGLDVLPRPIYSPRDPALEIKGETIVKSPTKIKIRNKDQIVSTVKDNPGSRYYIHVKWNGGTGGHEFLIINIDSNVYTMDAQQGLVESIDKTTYFDDVDYSGSYFARLDDKQLNRELLHKMNSMKTLVPWDWDKDVEYMKKHGMLGSDEDMLLPDGIGMRPAKKSDIDQLFDWELETISKNLRDKDGIRKKIKQDTLDNIKHVKVIVDFSKNKDIGMYEAYPIDDGEWWYLDEIYIIPEYRGRGIGSVLIRRDVETHDKLVLRVAADNTRAQKLYKSFGFKITEKTKDSYVMRLDKSKPVQESAYDDALIPVKDFKYDKVYYGDPTNGGSVRKLGDKPLFVTPRASLATIFLGRRELFHELSRRGYPKVNLGYDEWNKYESLPPDEPLTEVHVYVRNQPDLEPFTVKYEGYLHTIDCSNLKNNLYRYGWMSDPDQEVLIANIPSVKIDDVQRLGIVYHVRGISGTDIDKPVQEGADMITQEFDHNSEKIPVNGLSVNKFYFGSPIKYDGQIKLDRPLFVSPFEGIASIFIYGDLDLQNRIPRGSYNLQYEEWNSTSDEELSKPFREVHVYVEGYPELTPYTIENTGYIHTVNASKYLDNVYRYDWMADDLEYLIDTPERTVDIESVKQVTVKYYISGKASDNPKLGPYETIHEGTYMITQEFDPIKLYSAINKTKTEYRDKLINIGDFDRVPLNRATAEEYDEGHGQWVTPLSRYNIDDEHFEGTILVDEHGICPGYLVIDNRPDGSKWILGVESSMDYKSFAIVAQLLYLARTEFDTKNAIAPKTNKALIECYLDNGWTISDQNPHVVVLKYENDDEDEETDYEPDGVADVVTEYMIMELSKNTLMFHVSDQKNLDGQVFRPRVPDYLDPYDPKDKYFENNTTARVCFAPTIDGALNAITVNVQPTDPVKFDKMYVYIPEKPFNQYKHKTNKELIRDKDVYDANVTGEAWILEPVRLRLYGVIQVDQNRKVKRKMTVATSENKRGDRNVFSYRWHWLVKPKVISSTVGKVKYDAMAVCDMIAQELYQFKYGLCVDGRKKSNTTEADWDKYWRLQSPEQFEQSRVGNCYDFVEWEAGFLDAYYVKYKKYYISALYKDKLATHTFIVVPDNGKYIYLEGAFKRVADEIHHMKVFDKLEDIFEYIVECMVEFENVPEFDYGVWDYTDNGIKPGTDMKHFQEDITKGDPIHEGNVKHKKE